MNRKYIFVRMFSIILCVVMLMMFNTSCVGQGKLAPEATKAEGADIRVMSYNILHPSWSGVVDNLPVEGRDKVVSAIINDYRPDVVGLQEANWEWHFALKELLVDNGVYEQACNGDEENYIMTTFLYNTKTVKLIDSEVVDLDDGSDIRVVSIAVFQKRSGKDRFVVINTHPAPYSDQSYSKNCQDILDIVGDKMNKYKDLPVIMTGDYNTGEKQEFYSTIQSTLGVADAKYSADEIVNNYGTFFDPCWGGEFDPQGERAIDHIFVNDKAQSKLFSVIIDHDVNKASDHLPIYADVDLK